MKASNLFVKYAFSVLFFSGVELERCSGGRSFSLSPRASGGDVAPQWLALSAGRERFFFVLSATWVHLPNIVTTACFGMVEINDCSIPFFFGPSRASPHPFLRPNLLSPQHTYFPGHVLSHTCPCYRSSPRGARSHGCPCRHMRKRVFGCRTTTTGARKLAAGGLGKNRESTTRERISGKLGSWKMDGDG